MAEVSDAATPSRPEDEGVGIHRPLRPRPRRLRARRGRGLDRLGRGRHRAAAGRGGRVPRGAGRGTARLAGAGRRPLRRPQRRRLAATASSSTCRAGVRVDRADPDRGAARPRTAARSTGARWSCSRRVPRRRSGSTGPRPSDDVDALLNSVVELSVGQAATLRYVNTQDISESAWIFATQRAQVERDARLDWTALGFGSARGKVRMETKLAGPGLRGTGHRRLRRRRRAAPRLRHHPGARGAEHQLRPRLPRRPRRRRDRGLARHDPRRPRRPADRRLPGEPQPAALDRGPRRRDPGPGDRSRRRSLHPRRSGRPDRPRPALLPHLARPRSRPRRSR